VGFRSGAVDPEHRLRALAGAFWTLRSEVTRMSAHVEQILKEIGDHEKGMRGQLHEHAGVLTRHGIRH